MMKKGEKDMDSEVIKEIKAGNGVHFTVKEILSLFNFFLCK